MQPIINGTSTFTVKLDMEEGNSDALPMFEINSILRKFCFDIQPVFAFPLDCNRFDFGLVSVTLFLCLFPFSGLSLLWIKFPGDLLYILAVMFNKNC